MGSNKRLPSRQALITYHQQALDEIRNKPIQIDSLEMRILNKAEDAGMVRYHEKALKYLEDGGDISRTVDALSKDELLGKMRSEGYFV